MKIHSKAKLALTFLIALGTFFETAPPPALGSDKPICSVCHTTVSSPFLRDEQGNVYCSKSCWRKNLPKCSVCGEPLEGAYKTLEGKAFCSERCIEATLPKCEICKKPLRKAYVIDGHHYCQEHAEGPKCTACKLPISGKYGKLDDGRLLCEHCLDMAVINHNEAHHLYRLAARQLHRLTGLSEKLPPLKLVANTKMQALRNKNQINNMVARGFYTRTTRTTTKTNLWGKKKEVSRETESNIYLLRGMLPEPFVTSAVHELTHHLLAKYFPEISNNAPLWFEEGICQFTSYLVCKRKGFKKEAEQIENCTDKIYGNGFRYVQKAVRHHKWKALLIYLDEVDLSTLPEEAPTTATD